MFSPQHVRLVSSCYPNPNSGPDYKPNSQELSRLTYFGSNKPGKLAKIGQELEKRAQYEARKATAGYQKSRGNLLVTLGILKALCAECRQDISLFSRSVIVCVDYALASLPNDLEVAARSASVFVAYTTYTDGKASGVDEILSRTYLSVLGKFAAISRWSKKDEVDGELRSRFRLVGLAALTGAVGSDALYSEALASAKAQVEIIVPALLFNVQQAGLDLLQQQEPLIEETHQTSPYLIEFQPQRPMAERRAASIHAHQDGVEGPNMSDVTIGALRAMKTLLGRSDGLHVSNFLNSLFSTLDLDSAPGRGWSDIELCQWLALNITEWTQYQHRYAVPIQLKNKLIDTPDTKATDKLHAALLAMITAVFSSRTPIANLATSDVISSLIQFILRRVRSNPNDSLLPSVVRCVSSLATHLYYADQIQDFAEELIQRLVEIQTTEVGSDRPGRQQAIRCLVSCLAGLIHVASKHTTSADSPTVHRARSVSNAVAHGRGTSASSSGGRRNLISPETWQETLALLCEADYGVRAEYASTLALFVRSEIPKEVQIIVEEETVDPPRSKGVVDLSGKDEIMRFLHAMNAILYTLAVAPSLGLSAIPVIDSTQTSHFSQSTSTTDESTDTSDTVTSPTVQLTIQESTPVPTPIEVTPVPTPTIERRPSANAIGNGQPSSGHKKGEHRSRTASLALSFIESSTESQTLNQQRLIAPAPQPATPNDYSHIVTIVCSAVERSPARAIMTCVPMLLALDKLTCAQLPASDESTRGRRHAMREGVARVWRTIATAIECLEIQTLAEKALASFPCDTVLPGVPPVVHRFSHSIKHPQPFSDPPSTFLPDHALPPTIDPQIAITALASNQKLRDMTQLDRSALIKRLAVQWTPGAAMTDSIEKFMSHDNSSRLEGSLPFLKLAPALMHIDNKSLQSLRSNRNVGVGDLREALEGRASANRSMVGLGVGTPSLSSIGHHSLLESSLGGNETIGPGLQTRLRAASAMREANGEVKEILNRLGIGKQPGGRRSAKGVFKAPLTPKRKSSDGPQPTP